MLGSYLIGLREGLEAGLVVSILVAYLVKTDRRSLLPGIWTGVGLAVAASLAFGAALTFGPKGLTFEAQEAIGGTLSIVAVVLVTWMIFWMARHARNLSGELRGAIDRAASHGRSALAVVAALAVGREGLETAMFLWATTRAASGGAAAEPTAVPLIGATLGIATAVALAWLIYRGALKLNLAVFFRWTGAFLVLVAAGVLSYAVHDLQEAAILPGLHALAFDVSQVVAPGGVVATIVKGFFNLAPSMTVLEVIAWIAYVVPVMTLFLRRTKAPSAPAPARPVSSAPQASPAPTRSFAADTATPASIR